MILSVQGNGNVKCIPSHIVQGSFIHEITIVAPFINTTCVLKLKPPSEKWIEDIVMAPTMTADGQGAIFTASIPGSVATTAGRLLYHLEFVGGNGESVSSESGNINVLPGVITDVPDTVGDLSRYSLNQIYALLSRISGNVIGMKKSVKKMMTSVPATIVIPSSAWANNQATVELAIVRMDSVVTVSYDPDQAEEYAVAGIICMGQSDGSLYFSCENTPEKDITIHVLVMDVLPIEEGDDGEEEYYVVADYVTPQDYGAVGDGETDDYDAFVAMFADEPKYIYIPAGYYMLSNAVTIQPNTRHIKGAGIDMTVIYCKSGFISSGENSIYRLSLHDLSLYDKSEMFAGNAIDGHFSYSKFYNLKMELFNRAFAFGSGCWINSFSECEIVGCRVAVESSAESFNNNVFRNCVFQSNSFVFKDEYSNTANIFDGCDIEKNETVFYLKATTKFVVQNSYIENNTATIIYISTPCYGSDYSFFNCFFYSNKESNGWLADLPTSDISTVPYCVLTVDDCYIRNVSADYAPFAFHGDLTYSHVAVNIHKCRFYNKPDIYFDLFDTTGCAFYGTCYNRLPIDTDLIYHKTDTCRWYLRNGNSYGYMNQDAVFEVLGSLKLNSSEGKSFTTDISHRVSKLNDFITGGIGIIIDPTVSGARSLVLTGITEGGMTFTGSSGDSITIGDTTVYVNFKY